MTEKGVDPVRDAIRLVNCIQELVNCTTIDEYDPNDKKLKRGEAIRRRARSLPSLVASAGFISSLTFYMSKANEWNYQQVYEYLVKCFNNEETVNCFNYASSKDFLKEVSGEGEGGYATLTALIAVELGRLLKEMEIGTNYDRISTLPRLSSILLNIIEKGKEIEVEKFMIQFLMEVKRLAEAYFQ